MKAVKITDGIYCLPVNLESYQLFEGMWPMPNGISINSYIVQGDKTAMIDLVEDTDGKPAELEAELHSIPLDPKNIDYMIINHMEPDHTSWLPEFFKKNPQLKFYLTAKAAVMFSAALIRMSILSKMETLWIWGKAKYSVSMKLLTSIGLKP